MGKFDAIRLAINANIKANGVGDITGDALNNILNEIVNGVEAQDYITHFSVEDLHNLASGQTERVQIDVDSLLLAFQQKKRIFVPYHELDGYALMVGYAEDFIYAQVIYDFGSYILEIKYDGGKDWIEPSEIGSVSGNGFDDSKIQQKLTELSSEVGKVSEAVGKKADEQGYYPNLSVGMADNLLGHAPAVEREIVFDATASKDNDVTEDVARIEAIKGNSVVWNQLSMQEVGYADGSIKWTQAASAFAPLQMNDGVIEITVAKADNLACTIRSANRKFPSAHKMLVLYDIYVEASGYTDAKVKMGYFASPTTWLAEAQLSSLIGKTTTITSFVTLTSEANTLFVGIYSALPIGSVVKYSNIRIIDLTKMFQAGNEPTTIEEFYSRIPSGVDINAYNEGEVIHNYATGLKSVGFNAWDEEWEKGKFSTTDGTHQGADNTMRMVNKVAVLPNSTYYMKSSVDTWVLFYDKDGKVIEGYSTGLEKYQNACKVKNSSFVTPPNAAYLRAYFNQYFASVSTYQNDVCLHLAHTGYRNGEYAPYWEESVGLPNTLVFADGMKSAGSARDEVYYDRYAKKWRVIKRIGVVDMGTLTWYLSSSYASLFYAKVANIKPNKSNGISGNILVNKYSTRERNDLQNYDKVSALDNVYNVFVKDSAYTDVATFKNAMSGVMLYYELAEPIELDFDDYLPATMSAEERAKVHQFIYRVSDFGTEQMLTEEGVKSSALVADIVYGVDAFRTLVNLRKRVAALEK